MSVSALVLNNTAWRDYWGQWNALVEPLIAPIDRSKCHAPRFVLLPEVSQQTVPASGKIQYNFRLPGGSIIYAMMVPKPEIDYAIQLTDIALGHQLFQEPTNVSLLFTPGPRTPIVGEMAAFTLLPTPMPVVGDGLMSFEAWAAPGSTICIVLLAAEVTDCPVK